MKARMKRHLCFVILLSLVMTFLPLKMWAAPIAVEQDPLAGLSSKTEIRDAEASQSLGPGVEWKDLPTEVKVKVDPRILAELNGEVRPAHLGGTADQAQVAPDALKPLDKTRFLVYLKAKADLESIRAQRFTSRVAQRSAVLNALVSTAQATQGPVETLLSTRVGTGGVASYQPFYIFNGFAVEGDLDTIIALAQRDDVERIVANYPKIYYSDSAASRVPAPLNDLGGLSRDNWNIDLVDAERVWDEFGITGQGAVVAIYDSGADWTHPALQSRYRGYDAFGLGTDHNYHWFETDAFLYPGGDLGPSLTVQPTVYGDHGTHVLGTMVGDGGTPGTQVGMAPGAQWIGIVDQLEGIYGDDISTHKAFQWLLAPTDLTGQLSTADPSKAPDVINCSWGIASPADDFLEPDIAALRTAGIAVVFAAGNPSAGEGSIGSPGSAPSAITVGATNISDTVASFSGLGPSFWEGEQKPEVTAPGVDINSTIPGGGYSGLTWSGTSMAAPAVSGLVALLVSADLQDGIRDLDVDDIENFMTYTAIDLGPAGFDNEYGYGRIDAYTAVRWARSAGDLQGTITNQSTGLPVAGAVVTGTKTNPGDAFTVESGAAGEYATTVPAGRYNITVNAWGYSGATFGGQTVVTGALSIKNFALTPLPTAQLTGQVLSGTLAISGALVYVEDHPATLFTTGADGAFTLDLPVGTHAMVVEATGYRVLHEEVSVASGGSSHDFAMTPAPTILLVEADRAFGWFIGNPVKNYIGWALDYENYLYDEWEIQYITFNGTQTNPDGSIGYGVPMTTTLRAYDVVLWAHGGGWSSYYGYGGSPAQVNANDELADYLDADGRLILSGQDIGYWEDGDSDLYDNYVRANILSHVAASEGETATGLGFLGGLGLELTDASLKAYPNGATGFYPDAVEAQDGSAYSVMAYDNGSGSAVLAVDPCDAGYRMIYVAAGLEAFAPRTGPIPEYAEMLDRSLDWLSRSKPAYDVSITTTPVRQAGDPGSTVTYDVRVSNTGAMTDTFTLSVGGNLWATRVYSGGVELTTAVEIPPCTAQDLTVDVDIPATADARDEDTATLTATGNASDSADVTTMAFPLWQMENDTGSSGDYWFAGAGLECTPYAIGGVDFAGQSTLAYKGGQWVAQANKPTPFFGNSAGAVVINDQIYVPGGFTDVGAGDWAPSDVLEIYDPVSDAWTTGASMPGVRGGHSVAMANGKLYVFGGGPNTLFSDIYWHVWEYDPLADTWTVKGDMPYQMVFGGAARLNGKIYVGGDYRGYSDFYEYDPATDAWTKLASFPDGGRKDPILVGVGDKVYLYGGDSGGWGMPYTSAFAYDPLSDTWLSIPANNGTHVAATGAFAGGRLWAYGDDDGSWGTETLALTDAFCLSDKAVEQSEVQPGERLTYTIEIRSDVITLTAASVVDPIPAGTTWAGFGANPAGATYNVGQDQVEWNGIVPAKSDPLTFTFGVDTDLTGWAFGDLVTNTITFDSGTGQVFTQTVTAMVSFPDPSLSTKVVDKREAMAGDVLTYTVRVENGSAISDTFTLYDPIPANTTYVPGSLTYTLGTAGYDVGDDIITWAGILPEGTLYTNTSGDYEWGDSDGHGAVPGVAFDWIDISATGTNIGSGDDSYYCGLNLGLGFDFYGTNETSFCVSTNGFVSFDTSGSSDLGNDCPLPSTNGNAALIAGIWDDLVVEDGIYYQTFGTAPKRYTVIQWVGVRHYGGGDYFDFQIILYEGGAIKVQMLDAGPETGSGSTTGIEDYTESQGLTYGCNTAGSIHDNLAVVFLPDGAVWQSLLPYADVTFAVTTDDPLPANTWITNTATITGSLNTVERSATTWVNSVDLGASTKTADKAWAGTGDVVTYDFFLANTGLLAATAMLTDPIPAHTAYVPGSVACDDACAYDAGLNAITWTGDLVPGSPVTLTFAVTLTDTLVDLTPVTNTATLKDVAGTLYLGSGNVMHELTDVFVARSPDLGASFKQAVPNQVKPGDAVTYTVYVRNGGFVAAPGEMQDALPPDLTYVSGSLVCGSGACGYTSDVITWTGTVPARSMVPVQFQATVPASAAHGDWITNTATVTDLSWGIGYPVQVPVMVVEPEDLWLTKEGPGAVEAGAMLVYTLTYGNAGPFDATAVAQVTDVLLDNTTFVGSSPAGTYDAVAHTVTWDVGALDAGVSGTLVLTTRTPLTLPLTVLTNAADITVIARDVDEDNNTAFAETLVYPSAKIFEFALAPAQAVHYGEAGAAVNYTLEVLNTGNTTDTFDVAFMGHVWNTSASPMAVGPLMPGAKDNVLLTVGIPPSASVGDTDTVTVTITSQGNPARFQHVTLTTEVREAVLGREIYLPLLLRSP